MMNKMMKKAAIAAATMAISMASITAMAAENAQDLKIVEQESKGANILPHWANIYDDNGKVYDGNYTADLDLSTIKETEGGFTIDAKIWREDSYSADEVYNIKPGDKILYDGEVITVDKVETDVKDNEERVHVNGGYDNGGLTFSGGEGGGISARGDDDRSGFEVVAEGKIFIDSKVVLTDKRDLANKDGKTYSGAQEIKAFFEKESPEMNHYNTRLEFLHGNLAAIHLDYTP